MQTTTDNIFFVGLQSDRIIIIRPVPLRLSKEDALNLAAFIVTLADEDGAFDNLRHRIENRED